MTTSVVLSDGKVISKSACKVAVAVEVSKDMNMIFGVPFSLTTLMGTQRDI